MKSTTTKNYETFHAAKAPAGFDPSQPFVVCPWGTVQTRKGPVTVNEHTLAVFRANQKAARRDAVAGDFEHSTLRGKEPVKVSGYYDVDVIPGKGIVATLRSATPDLQFVREGHYPDISPAIERTPAGVVESLHSFAFCRHGEMAHPDLELFSVEVCIDCGGHDEDSPQTKAPHYSTLMTDAQMLADLLSLLTGETIAPDATPEAKMAAIAKAKAKASATPAPAEMSADLITRIDAKLDALEKTVTAFAAADATREVDSLIMEAQRDGKNIGLKRERLVAMGAEGTREYLGTLTAGVVTGGGVNATAADAAKQGKADKVTDVFSAEAIAMMKRNGTDPEEMLAEHNRRIAEAAGE